jgi:hypothetical protein
MRIVVYFRNRLIQRIGGFNPVTFFKTSKKIEEQLKKSTGSY